MNFQFSFIICVFLCTLLSESNAVSQTSCSSKEPEQFEVEFYISTKSKLDQRYVSSFQKDLTNFDFSPELNTVVIVHGFLFTHQMNPIVYMRDAFLKSENMNVITVDWSQGCNEADNYAQAVANTQSTASEIKKFFLKLVKSYKQKLPTEKWGKIHFVGHSLGAHIAGQAAKLLNKKKLPTEKWGKIHFVGHSLGAHTAGQAAKLLNKNNVAVHRVTGLDPAQPCFEDIRLPLRLSTSSAPFVDVIHTNGEKNALGLFEPMGHVDFYVNRGKKQPGCSDFDFSNFSMSNFMEYPMRVVFCPHNRAMSLFTQSILQKKAKQCSFWGHPWDMKSDKECNKKCSPDVCKNNNCLEMGINAHNVDSKIKIFCVFTSEAAPYCDI